MSNGKKPAPFKKTVCIDFDGVIHSYNSGWKGHAVIPDDPVPGAIDAILGYLDAGFTVAISSSRSKNLFGRRAMKRYLAKHIADHWQNRDDGTHISLAECECWGDAAEIAYHRIKWPLFKPAAFVSIDDRAICFDGTFPTPQAITEFKPWNKR